MTNSRIISNEFEFFEPAAMEEALHLLDRYGKDAKVIAGGTDLLVQMKLETCSPKVLISIGKLPELKVLEDGDKARIGAGVTLSRVLTFFSTKKKFQALSEAIRSLGTVPIRNMGTVGGNLCNASPSADSAPPLLVFDARLKVSSLKEDRVVPLTDFFVNVNQTAMSSNEIVTEICFPPMSESVGSSFLKIGRVGAGISKVNTAVFLERNRGVCTTCRIALGSVSPVPMRVRAAEEIIAGEKVVSGLFEEAAKIAGEEINPITDIRSTAHYRRKIAAVLVKEALEKAWQRAEAFQA